MSASSTAQKPLSPGERFAAACCLSVAALMCGTACFNINTNINLHLLDSKPVQAPAAPRASQSAATQKPGSFRIGISGDGAGFRPQSGEGTSAGQAALNARVGIAPKGLELAAGLAIPVLQPYGMARYQFVGKSAADVFFLSGEAGGAVAEQFAGFSLGSRLGEFWEIQANGRGGAYYGDGYGEAGLSLVLKPASFMDMVTGLGFRYYGSAERADVTRAGVSLEFGLPRLPLATQLKLEQYDEDPLRLFKAGEYGAAAIAARKILRRGDNIEQSENWELYSKILKAKGDLIRARKAHYRAMRLNPPPPRPQEPEEIPEKLESESNPLPKHFPYPLPAREDPNQ
jgi:hypothetical protein